MSSDRKFAFVQQLAIDLNRGEIRLPSFPDVVIQIRQMLEDPDCGTAEIAEVLSSEPVLAARVLAYSNSAAMGGGGDKVISLNAAIARIGLAQLRTTALAYAVEQLHETAALGAMKSELQNSWQRSLSRAAMAQVLCSKQRRLNGDAAFLAGLVHRIGDLYFFTKYEEFSDLLGDRAEREALMAEWSAAIGENIVESWDFPADVCATVNLSEDDDEAAEPTLRDAVRVAVDALAHDPVEFPPSASFARLGFEEADCDELREQYQSRLDSLSSAAAAAA